MINQVILFSEYAIISPITQVWKILEDRLINIDNKFDSCNTTNNSFTKGQVRYINILTNLRGFQKKKNFYLILVVFS